MSLNLACPEETSITKIHGWIMTLARENEMAYQKIALLIPSVR